MRQIGTIADGDAAQRLADYLLTLDITTKLDSKPEGTAVWVHREERVDEARREMGEFLRAPDDAKYQGVDQEARALRKRAEREERKHARNSISLSGSFAYRPAGRCPLTILLIAASVLVTLLTGMGTDTEWAPRLFLPSFHERTVVDVDGQSLPVSQPDEPRGLGGVLRGEVWRLITPIFVHLGPLHLLFNMTWLYQLGGLIEMRRGSLKLLALVLVSAVASNLGEVAWAGPVRAGGMSGVVYALFGYVWMVGKYDPTGGMSVTPYTFQIMIFWLFFCMLGPLGPVADTAHVVGLLVGLAIGFAPQAPRVLRRWL